MDPAAPATTPPVTDRITVALTPKVAADLAKTQERSHLSKTDIANRAISLYEFIDAQLAAEATILVRAKDGTTQIVTFL